MLHTITNHREKRILLLITATVVTLLGLYLVTLIVSQVKEYRYIGRQGDQPNQITVEGTAQVVARPDIATVTIGAVSEQATVEAAQEEVTRKMNTIISDLKSGFAIADPDIQTSQYSVSPRYETNDRGQRIAGYTAQQSVTVKIREFDKIGSVLGRVGALGANVVNGPSFTIDDEDVYRAEAREEAIAEARAKAESIAKAAHIRLGRLVSFNEQLGGVPPYYPMAERGMAVDSALKLTAPAIEPGSQEVLVTVMLTYEIK